MIWTDVIDVMNFIFIANDMWIMWSILIVILTVIISIGKNV
ncbi:hypothetical protein [uncultured Mediterranean phage]|nr:hypothetical protein [uncultured Mediterranean phage]